MRMLHTGIAAGLFRRIWMKALRTLVCLLAFAWRPTLGFNQSGQWGRAALRIRATRGISSLVSKSRDMRRLELSIAPGLSEVTDPAVETSNLFNEDPAMIEFDHIKSGPEEGLAPTAADPFVNMLRDSSRYIADHRGKTAVFHILGDMLEKKGFSDLMDDIALSWLLGLKIVIVLGCRFDHDSCSLFFSNEHECHNSLRVTDDRLVRKLAEEAGYIRFEVERLLNRCLRLKASLIPSSEHSSAPDGNVVGGNFYTASPFGVVHGVDYKNTGYPIHVHGEKIQSSLQNSDIVLLTTVGTSRQGELVNVNGDHLAAFVAANLRASKLIYFSSEGTVLRSKTTHKRLQDVPLSCALPLVDYYKLQVHPAVGFATFDKAKEKLEPSAVELLLHIGWSTWALENGARRAHIVGPGNGALLEELFTANDGANTCIRQDNDSEDLDYDFENDMEEEYPTFVDVSSFPLQ